MLKSLILVVSLCTGFLAQAQNNATSSAEVAQIEAGTQTSVTNTPLLDTRLHLTLGSENYSFESAQRTFNGKGPAISSNWVGALYDLNKNWNLELRQYFQMASNKENLTGRSKVVQQENVSIAETMLKVAYKTKSGLWGSKPVSTDLRFFAPTDRAGQENKEIGRFRSDTAAEWMLSPKWSLTGWLSPRVMLNSSANPDTVRGADAAYYQVKVAPILSYYVNDKMSGYCAYTLDVASKEAQRGTWAADANNVGTYEVGAWMSWGPLSFNPALMSDANLNNRDGSFLTADSRAFSYETLVYNLNLYATF